MVKRKERMLVDLETVWRATYHRLKSAIAKKTATCRCVDCSGDHHVHDSHCAYMREIHGT